RGPREAVRAGLAAPLRLPFPLPAPDTSEAIIPPSRRRSSCSASRPPPSPISPPAPSRPASCAGEGRGSRLDRPLELLGAVRERREPRLELRWRRVDPERQQLAAPGGLGGVVARARALER